jgi:polygalacturonase
LGAFKQPGDKNALDFITFENCKWINVIGHGVVDGLGYEWWAREWKNENPIGRPKLLKFKGVQNAEIKNVTWLNSPFWTIDLEDVDNVRVHDFKIHTSILKQKGWISPALESKNFDHQFNDFCYNFLLHFFKDYAEIIDFFFSGQTDFFSWPVFPLNTDGIDIAGSNVNITRVSITTWDDAVAVKPSHKTDKVAQDGCT